MKDGKSIQVFYLALDKGSYKYKNKTKKFKNDFGEIVSSKFKFEAKIFPA